MVNTMRECTCGVSDSFSCIRSQNHLHLPENPVFLPVHLLPRVFQVCGPYPVLPGIHRGIRLHILPGIHPGTLLWYFGSIRRNFPSPSYSSRSHYCSYFRSRSIHSIPSHCRIFRSHYRNSYYICRSCYHSSRSLRSHRGSSHHSCYHNGYFRIYSSYT